MPKSSATYATELVPDPRLRIVVIVVAAAALGGGLLVIVTLPVAPGWRAGFGAAWCAVSAVRLAQLLRGFARCARLRLAADGSLAVIGAGGPPAQARLLPGSVVLSTCAWLRIGFDDGSASVELLAGNARGDHAWRRLQVIWRHLGADA
ncbi:MAG: hypothetical protein R3315_09530 [Woeseiaceae bacterium]|nr:hypothetical protein [Woeseiaceae bacterium]